MIGARFRREMLSSNGVTRYVVVAWLNGLYSCDCAGWANRKDCRHCKEVRQNPNAGSPVGRAVEAAPGVFVSHAESNQPDGRTPRQRGQQGQRREPEPPQRPGGRRIEL